MEKRIFVNKNNVIESYQVVLAEEEFRQIQDELDTWYGKGDLKSCRAAEIYPMNGKKLQVVSKEAVGRGERFSFCPAAREEVDMYNYQFYEYIPHPLSRLCDAILKDEDMVELSKHIRFLINWSGENREESEFAGRLLGCVSFEKLPIEDIVISNLTEVRKKKLLERLLDAISPEEVPLVIVASSKEFAEELDTKVLKTDSEEDKKYTKRRIVNSLPVDSKVFTKK